MSSGAGRKNKRVPYSDRERALKGLVDMLGANASHWCPIVSSHAIKKAIVERINELGVTALEVCVRADVSFNSFQKFYLRCDEPLSKPSIRAEEIMKIGDLIGLKVRVRVFAIPKEEIDVNEFVIEKYIPVEQRKKNKKLG